MKILATCLILVSYKGSYWTALFVSLLACVPLKSTTVAMVITPNGIVIGADGRTIKLGGNQRKPGTDSAKKLAVIQNRLVIASLGLQRPGNGAVMPYDFTSWLSRIEQRLMNSHPSSKERVHVHLLGFDVILKGGTMTRTDPLEDSYPLVDYVIAGYKDKRPMVLVIHFYVDWERQTLIGPKRISMHPAQGASRDSFGMYSFGFNWAISNLTNPNSYAYRQAVALAPLETKTLLAYEDLSIEQAKRSIRVLIDIEKQVEPTVVGGDTMIVEISTDGNANVEYRNEALSPQVGGQQ